MSNLTGVYAGTVNPSNMFGFAPLETIINTDEESTDLTVLGNFIIEDTGTCTINTLGTFTEGINVVGGATIDTETVGTLTVTNTLTVDELTTLAADLDVGGNSVFDGTITCDDTATFNTGFVSNSGSTINGGLTLNGTLTHTGNEVITGNVTVNGTVTADDFVIPLDGSLQALLGSVTALNITALYGLESTTATIVTVAATNVNVLATVNTSSLVTPAATISAMSCISADGVIATFETFVGTLIGA